MVKLETLTPRQKTVFDFIATYQREYGIAPTVREICNHLGLRSPGGVHRILNVLKEKGYVQADAGKKRSWKTGHTLSAKGVPLIGTIAAGEPLETLENVEEILHVSPEIFGCETCFCLRVKGDSMINAHIMEGDLAVIRPQQQLENGEIGAVMIHDLLPEATLKRIYRDKSSIRLHADNENYAPFVFKGRKRKLVVVLGKMIGIIRR